MKKRIIISTLSLSLLMTTAPAVSFAEAGQPAEKPIQTVEQLKAEMADCMEDGQMSVAEEKNLKAAANEDVIADLVHEKLDLAAEMLNSSDAAVLQSLPEDAAYAVQEYDLGDGCLLRVELTDCAEGCNPRSGIGLLATSGSSEMWKDYGNRYFTATATVDCKVATASLRLENHYILSAEGIDERKGVASGNGEDSKIRVAKNEPVISDKTARTPGASDVNMYCDFTVKISGGVVADTRVYRLNTTVKYLAHDKTGKRIKVGHAWNLTKIS